MDEVIRVALIDDDALVATALARVLFDEGIQVSSVSTTIADGIDCVRAMRPDVVLADVMLVGRPDGLDLAKRLDLPGMKATPVLLISSFGVDHLVDLARRSGAAGYVTKGINPGALASTIRVVAAGGQAFPHVRRARQPSPTPREVAVIEAVAAGWSTKEIAGRLAISTRTVEAHLRRLFERNGVASRTQLVVLAIRRGWITELPTGESAHHGASGHAQRVEPSGQCPDEPCGIPHPRLGILGRSGCSRQLWICRSRGPR